MYILNRNICKQKTPSKDQSAHSASESTSACSSAQSAQDLTFDSDPDLDVDMVLNTNSVEISASVPRLDLTQYVEFEVDTTEISELDLSHATSSGSGCTVLAVVNDVRFG